MCASATSTLDKPTFDFVCKLVQDHSAIALEPSKHYLVESRLAPIATRRGLASVSDLVAQLRNRPFGEMHVQVVEAMTTNETSFFRDLRPFEVLASDILPRLIAARANQRKLSIWSAACSTGQEPDSIAMTLLEHFPILSDWKVEILATDLSQEVLERARAGQYTQLEVNRGLPSHLLIKYFERGGLRWQVKADVRRFTRFAKVNLAEPWPVLPTMDVIFMRNVLIYFGTDTKRAILGKLRRQLAADGALILGGAETTFGIDDSWQRVNHGKTSVYRPGNP
jgi:chemotaxis protein methyltransferase CheR